MKKIFFVLIFLFIFEELFSQVAQKVISLDKPSWQAVLGGNAIAPAEETRWGMAILTDGRMLNSCTADGKIIWRRGTKGKPTFITQRGDFFYLVTGEKRITLVNSSGVELWNASAPFEITEKPVISNDGRIFVHGKNAIACFGNKGVRKWYAKTPTLASLPTFVLSDGSALVFTLDEAFSGQTTAKRFSRYGEPLEDVIFSDVVDTAVQCSRGILVAMKDSSMGLISEEKGKVDSPWIQKSYLSTSAFAILPNEETGNVAFLFRSGGNTTAILLRTHSGDFLNQFILPALDRTSISLSKTTYSGFFISDKKIAFEFAEDGTIWWQTALPPEKTWNQICYTKTNTIVLCMSDWVIRGYKTISPPKAVAYQPFDEALEEPPKIKPSVRFSSPLSSSEGLELRAFSEAELKAAERTLKKGDYGEKERAIVEGLRLEAERYLNSQTSSRAAQSYFAQNPDYTQRLLLLLSETGIDDFSQYYAALIRAEKEPNTLAALIKSAGKQGFDLDGEILTSFEYVYHASAFKENTAVLQNLCDATFEICRFMGRPALIRHGKDILKQLSAPPFPTRIREYATKTLKRFAEENAG